MVKKQKNKVVLSASLLIDHGMFPRELPSCFSSLGLSKCSKKNSSFQKPYTSIFAKYSIPKDDGGRRTLAIVNPIHYSLLCNELEKNQKVLSDHLSQSNNSTSFPKEDLSGTRAYIAKEPFEVFLRQADSLSSGEKFQIRADISRYYNTLYTHSIPWALHTKSVSKINTRGTSLIGNLIDQKARNLQSGQTMGLPTGPDASFIIAEIIGTAIDIGIKKALGKKFVRYIDDIYFYADSEEEVHKKLSQIISVFSEFELEINDSKTVISKIPYTLESRWVSDLRLFDIDVSLNFESRLSTFLSLAIKHHHDNPKEGTLTYALRKIEKLELKKSDWKILENWLIKIILMENHSATSFSLALSIIINNQAKITRNKVKALIHKLVEQGMGKGKSHEISWALWLAYQLEIKLQAKMLVSLMRSEDVTSNILTVYLYKRKLISGDKAKLLKEINKQIDSLTAEDLWGPKWLFAYQMAIEGWDRKRILKILVKTDGYKTLVANGITFVNTGKMFGTIPSLFGGTY